MTEPQPTTSPTPITPAPPPGVFGTKIPSTVTFAVGVLLFIMPFIEIKCSSMTIQSVNGLQLATGFKVKSPGENSGLSGFETKDDLKMDKSMSKEGANIYAALALVFGVFGFFLSKPLGTWLQRYITTEADLGNMQIADVSLVRKGVHRIVTK